MFFRSKLILLIIFFQCLNDCDGGIRLFRKRCYANDSYMQTNAMRFSSGGNMSRAFGYRSGGLFSWNWGCNCNASNKASDKASSKTSNINYVANSSNYRLQYVNEPRPATSIVNVRVKMTNGKIYQVPVINSYLPIVSLRNGILICDYTNKMVYDESFYPSGLIVYKSIDNGDAYPPLKLYNIGEIKEKFEVCVVLASGRPVFIPVINGRLPQVKEWIDTDGKLNWIALDYAGGREYTESDKAKQVFYKITGEISETSEIPKSEMPLEGGYSDLPSAEGATSDLPQEGDVSNIKPMTEETVEEVVEEVEPVISAPEATEESTEEVTTEEEAEEGDFAPLVPEKPVKGNLSDLEDTDTPPPEPEDEEKVKLRNSYLPSLD